MLRSLAAAALLFEAACAWGASPPATDAQWESYFALWAKDETATPHAVEEYYATRVNYYGHEMTPAEVYRDKLHLTQLWPIRNYHVAPGTVVTKCSQDGNTCAVTLVMDYLSGNPALGIGVQGATTVSLMLTRQGGMMKIERETGVPLLRSSCKVAALDWGQRSHWRCSASYFPPLPNLPS
jgi:hypothetical protein